MQKQYFYLSLCFLSVFGIFSCAKPTNTYKVTIEAIGDKAMLNHVHIEYYNAKKEKVKDHNEPYTPSFTKEYKALKGKKFTVQGDAKLPGVAGTAHGDHDHHSHSSHNGQQHTHKEVKVKITIEKDGTVVEDKTKESENGKVSNKLEVQ